MLQKKELVVANKDDGSMLIDARLLHRQLRITTQFSNWIQRRIEEFGFEANKDFYPILVKSKSSKYRGGRKRTEYHLTMDMAKELAMLERNEIGKNIRQYFIAVEKEARATAGSSNLLPKGLESLELNGRRLYPYHHLCMELGYSRSGGIYRRKYRYPNHFIEFNGLLYTSEEMANLMALSRTTYKHRNAIKDMQPLLPLDFGTPIQFEGGQH